MLFNRALSLLLTSAHIHHTYITCDSCKRRCMGAKVAKKASAKSWQKGGASQAGKAERVHLLGADQSAGGGLWEKVGCTVYCVCVPWQRVIGRAHALHIFVFRARGGSVAAWQPPYILWRPAGTGVSFRCGCGVWPPLPCGRGGGPSAPAKGRLELLGGLVGPLGPVVLRAVEAPEALLAGQLAQLCRRAGRGGAALSSAAESARWCHCS